jgi:hypothetical protein
MSTSQFDLTLLYDDHSRLDCIHGHRSGGKPSLVFETYETGDHAGCGSTGENSLLLEEPERDLRQCVPRLID